MQLFLRLNYFFVLKVRRSPLPARALHSCLPRGAGQTVPWRVQVCLPAGSKPWAVTSASGGEVLISFQSGFRKYQFWNEALQVHCLVPQSVTLTMRQCLSKHLFLQKPPFTKLQLRCKSVESHMVGNPEQLRQDLLNPVTSCEDVCLVLQTCFTLSLRLLSTNSLHSWKRLQHPELMMSEDAFRFISVLTVSSLFSAFLLCFSPRLHSCLYDVGMKFTC